MYLCPLGCLDCCWYGNRWLVDVGTLGSHTVLFPDHSITELQCLVMKLYCQALDVSTLFETGPNILIIRWEQRRERRRRGCEHRGDDGREREKERRRMAEEIVLYDLVLSPFATIVRLMFAEKGLTYKKRELKGMTQENLEP